MSAYCSVAEVGAIGINADALTDIDPADLAKEIGGASGVMDSYFAGSTRFTLPLVSWGAEVRKCCAVLAGVGALRTRGYNPEDDKSVKETVDFWMAWLAKVAAGDVLPVDIVDSPPGTDPSSTSGGRMRVSTSTSRGYSTRGTGQSRGVFQSD